MTRLIWGFIIVAFTVRIAYAQDTLRFNSPDEVFKYAESHSVTFKNATQQALLSKYQTLAAQFSKWNLKVSLSFTATDNTKLATSFVPAEIFGGQAGTFRAITLGQKYASSLSTSPQFDILNLYAMAMVKVSKTNEELTRVANQLNKKSLCESITASYYNILSYQWQLNVLEESLVNADSLKNIMQHKFDEGIARSQDVNNSKANALAVKNEIQQMQIQLRQEYNNFKLLCDIDVSIPVSINTTLPKAILDGALEATGNLDEQQYEWERKYQQADLKANKKWFLPTLSFFSNFGWNQNTDNHFFDNTKWLATSYVGLGVSVPLVPDITKAANVRYDRINLTITENNIEHYRLQDSINNCQMTLDYQKAFNSYRLDEQIEQLKKDSYRKNIDIYEEGILSATDMLNSFNDWLSSRVTTVTQLANSEYMKSKIIINNSFQ